MEPTLEPNSCPDMETGNGIKNLDVVKRVRSDGEKATALWLQEIGNSRSEDAPSIRAYEKLVERIISNNRSFRKSMSKYPEKLEHFLSQDIVLPKKSTSVPKHRVASACSKSCTLSSAINVLNAELTSCRQVKRTLTNELDEEKQCTKKLQTTLDNVMTRVSKQKQDLKRVTGREDYWRGKAACARESLDLYAETQQSMQELETLRSKVLALENEKEALQSKVDSLECKLETLTKDLNDTVDENNWMRLILSDNSNSGTYVLYDEDGRRYTTATTLCIYKLLELRVAVSKIPAVIEAVMNLVGKSPNRLPSKSTILDMNIQRLSLSQKQLAQEFATQKNTCLLTDETSEFGVKYMGYHASDSSGRLWVLGLREIETKSAQDTLSTFKDILTDIDTRSSCTDKEVSSKIMGHISATMSDRASTEVKFNELLQIYRQELLPLVLENYDEMAEDDKIVIGTLQNFFCGLHSLVHIAEAANAALLEAESGMFEVNPPIFDEKFRNIKESGTTRLIRTACKTFARGADEANGCHGTFTEYVRSSLRSQKLFSLPLEPYRGNRFNILFSNAVGVYFLKDKMITFLEGHQSNRLLRAVLADLKVPEYIAGLKALALVSKYVTEPLWCLIEAKDTHILDMNERYKALIQFFDDVTDNLNSFILGEMCPFTDMTPKQDSILQVLLKPWEEDSMVIVILGTVFPTLMQVCKHLFRDHIEGGVWENASVKVREVTHSVPKHNKFSESVFGQLDQLLRAKPSISTIAAEAFIMYCTNRTQQWLSEKSANEQDRLVAEARKDVKSIRSKFIEKKREIQEARRAAVEANLKKKKEAEKAKLRRREQYTSDMIEYGLWQTVEKVDCQLASLESKAQKEKALKAQLRFRQHVLQQVASNPEVYAFSSGGKPHSLDILTQHVKTLIQDACHLGCVPNEQESLLVGKVVRHRFQVETRSGRRKKKESQWFRGKVLSQVPGYSQWFNIKYESDEAIYTYRLQEDYAQGDLVILV